MYCRTYRGQWHGSDVAVKIINQWTPVHSRHRSSSGDGGNNAGDDGSKRGASSNGSSALGHAGSDRNNADGGNNDDNDDDDDDDDDDGSGGNAPLLEAVLSKALSHPHIVSPSSSRTPRRMRGGICRRADGARLLLPLLAPAVSNIAGLRSPPAGAGAHPQLGCEQRRRELQGPAATPDLDPAGAGAPARQQLSQAAAQPGAAAQPFSSSARQAAQPGSSSARQQLSQGQQLSLGSLGSHALCMDLGALAMHCSWVSAPTSCLRASDLYCRRCAAWEPWPRPLTAAASGRVRGQTSNTSCARCVT